MFLYQLNAAQFLFLYFGLIIAGWLVVKLEIRRRERALPEPAVSDREPYVAAYLRAGPTEAVHIATLSLIDRQMLLVDGSHVQAARGAKAETRDPLELGILTAASHSILAGGLDRVSSVRTALAKLRAPLAAASLVRSRAVVELRLPVVALVWGCALAFGLLRAANALMHSGKPIGFLLALSVLAVAIALAQLFSRKTALGDAVLRHWKSRNEHLLKQRAGMGGMRAALLAALFGASAVALPAYALHDRLYPQSAGSSGGDSGGSDSSDGCGGGGGGCGGCS